MILHTGERVFWGAPEVIYLEGIITKLNEATQTVMVHIEGPRRIPRTLLGRRSPSPPMG